MEKNETLLINILIHILIKTGADNTKTLIAMSSHLLQPLVLNKPMVVTEDLGKIFEMAICLLYDTPYDGKYKYSMLKAEQLRDKMTHLKEGFPHTLVHTAKNGARYDFTGEGDIKLSAKTTKKDFKVCPQVIGQPSKKKFCEHFGIDTLMTNDQIKDYIQVNIKNLLKDYFEYTFSSPIVYYNEHKNILWLITKKQDIDFDDSVIEFSHIKKNKMWNESSSLYINGLSTGEFQVHNHRDNIKFRWHLGNLMKSFHNGQSKKYFEIIDLHTLENI